MADTIGTWTHTQYINSTKYQNHIRRYEYVVWRQLLYEQFLLYANIAIKTNICIYLYFQVCVLNVHKRNSYTFQIIHFV